MKHFSNTYIFIFSSVMVVLVAAFLAIISTLLKPEQEKNVKAETMQNILSAVHIESTRNNADEIFRESISESYVVDEKGEKIEGVEPLTVDLGLEMTKLDKLKALRATVREQQESPFKKFLSRYIKFRKVDAAAVNRNIGEVSETRQLPVYVSVKDGDPVYVFPVRGKGLWGPIWGYIALKSDMNTIHGAVFDHKSETPGLGAEINLPWFEKAFEGKKLYENEKFVSVEVMKGGAPDDDAHAVDAITGGTITSKGVEAMLFDNLKSYEAFFEKIRK